MSAGTAHLARATPTKNQNKKHPRLGEIPALLSCETTGHGNPPVSQANGELWYRRRRTRSWLTRESSGLAKTYNNKSRLRACTCTHVLVPGSVQGFVPRGSPVLGGREQGREGPWAVGPGQGMSPSLRAPTAHLGNVNGPKIGALPDIKRLGPPPANYSISQGTTLQLRAGLGRNTRSKMSFCLKMTSPKTGVQVKEILA